MKDKKSVQFVLTTVIGGVLFLVPVVFLGMILTKAAGYMMVIAQPLAAWISVDSIGGVALKLGTAERVGLEMQKLSDGRSVIYIPSAPSPWSGVTQVLPPDQVTYLNVPVTKIIEITESYGHGVGELLACKDEGAGS